MSSPLFEVESNVSCFQFNYFMMDDDSHFNVFTLYLLPNASSSERTEIWSTGAGLVNIDKWNSVDVQIDQKGPYRVSLDLFMTFSNFYFSLDSSVLVEDLCQFKILIFFKENAAPPSVPLNREIAVGPKLATRVTIFSLK